MVEKHQIRLDHHQRGLKNNGSTARTYLAATDLLMIIGDHAQLGPTNLSKLKENPFAMLSFLPYSRLVENG